MLLKITIFANFNNIILEESLSYQFKDYQSKKLLNIKYIPLDNYIYKDYVAYNINVNNILSSPQKTLAEDTLYMQVFLFSAMGFLLMLPESVTKWDLDALEEKSFSQRWREHIKAGPVMDEDEIFINYIGHPISGAWYYTMARNDGMSPVESFLFSAFVSTFIWEYGYEAFAEIPSIQDLIATPVVGALLGEYMFYLEKQLDKNRGKIWGQRWLGSTSYFFIDPIGNIADGLSDLFELQVTLKLETYNQKYSMQQQDYNDIINKPQGQFNSYDYGIIINLEF